MGAAGLPGSIVSKGGGDLSDGIVLLFGDISAEYYQQPDGCHGRITQKSVMGQRRELFAPLPILYQ